MAAYRSRSVAGWQCGSGFSPSRRGGGNRRPFCFHYREGVRESSVRCANDLSCVAFELRPLGYYPGMGGTSFLFKLWVGTARCDGCLHATRRTRAGCLSIAVLALLQFLSDREEKELR